MNFKKYILFLMITFPFLIGCVVTEDLSINEDESGSSQIEISVEDFFITVLNDFSEFSTDDNNKPIMDLAIDDTANKLTKNDTTTNVLFTKVGKNSYEGYFDYTSLSTLISDLGETENQTIMVVNDNKLNFYLDLDNYSQLTKAIPFLADPNFEPFGPEYNEGLTEDDYLEMISFMLGEEGPDAIRNSVITLNFETPSPIVSYSGGQKISSTLFQYSFPLIDFLLLAEPLEFELEW
ncbi:MAG: hypothetical protein ACPKM0_00535 [Pleomorphochaeta sp.]